MLGGARLKVSMNLWPTIAAAADPRPSVWLITPPSFWEKGVVSAVHVGDGSRSAEASDVGSCTYVKSSRGHYSSLLRQAHTLRVLSNLS